MITLNPNATEQKTKTKRCWASDEPKDEKKETNFICLPSLALTFIRVSVLTQKPLIYLKPTLIPL